MNLSCLYKKVYKFFIPLAGQKNKPNSNPIKANLRSNVCKLLCYNLSYEKRLPTATPYRAWGTRTVCGIRGAASRWPRRYW